MDSIICWFSGGRDSALSCYIAKQVADAKDLELKLVHINTRTPRPRDVDEYVAKYADWLGVDLITIQPDKSFEEYAMKYNYWPSIVKTKEGWQNMRWCYYYLKRLPIIKFLSDNAWARRALHVFGIRKSESLFREREYDSTFGTKCYTEKLCIKYWLPLLNVDSAVLDKLIRKYNIPQSPVWAKLGSSGECMCLAGASYETLVKLRIHYPDVVKELVRIDDIIQSRRRKGPSYPTPLKHLKMTLRQWYESFKPPMPIEYFLSENEDEYVGKACQGSCMLG